MRPNTQFADNKLAPKDILWDNVIVLYGNLKKLQTYFLQVCNPLIKPAPAPLSS